MRYLGVPAPLVALFLLLPSPAIAADLEILARVSASLQVVRDARFSPGWQPGLTASAIGELTVASLLGGGVEMGFEGAAPSPVAELVSYRGYRGVRARLFASIRAPATSGGLACGLRAGYAASYLGYGSTSLRFVSSGPSLEGLLALSPPSLPWLALELALPVELHLRPDLACAWGVGLAFSVGIHVPRPPVAARAP